MWRIISGVSLMFLIVFSLKGSDSLSVQEPAYLDSEEANQIADPLTLDVNILNRCVFHAINEYREQKNKPTFTYSEELSNVALQFQKSYEHRKFTTFERMVKKFSRSSLDLTQKEGYKGTLVNVSASSFNVIDYNNKPFFYERRDTTSPLHLFYGDRKKVKNDEDKRPIPYYSYAALSRQVVKQMQKLEKKAKSMDKAYRDVGVYTMLDYKSLYRNGIPQVKVVILYGGFQIDLLKDLTND